MIHVNISPLVIGNYNENRYGGIEEVVKVVIWDVCQCTCVVPQATKLLDGLVILSKSKRVREQLHSQDSKSEDEQTEQHREGTDLLYCDKNRRQEVVKSGPGFGNLKNPQQAEDPEYCSDRTMATAVKIAFHFCITLLEPKYSL